MPKRLLLAIVIDAQPVIGADADTGDQQAESQIIVLDAA